MLQSKPQGQCPFGSGDEDFKGFLPYIRMAAILVMWQRCGEQIVVPFNYWDSIWKFGFNCPSGFCEEDGWRVWQGVFACFHIKKPYINSVSYEHKIKSASNWAQYVSIGMSTFCWNIRPPNSTKMLSISYSGIFTDSKSEYICSASVVLNKVCVCIAKDNILHQENMPI